MRNKDTILLSEAYSSIYKHKLALYENTPAGATSFNSPIQIALSAPELESMYKLVSKMPDEKIKEFSFIRLKAAIMKAYATSTDMDPMPDAYKFSWMPDQLEDDGIPHIKFGMTISEIETFFNYVLEDIPYRGPGGMEGTPLESLHGKLEEIQQWQDSENI